MKTGGTTAGRLLGWMLIIALAIAPFFPAGPVLAGHCSHEASSDSPDEKGTPGNIAAATHQTVDHQALDHEEQQEDCCCCDEETDDTTGCGTHCPLSHGLTVLLDSIPDNSTETFRQVYGIHTTHQPTGLKPGPLFRPPRTGV